MTEDEMTAAHFGAYYRLLLKEPARKPRLHLRDTPAGRGTGFIHGAICPPALFARE
jgi:hypothetical protein